MTAVSLRILVTIAVLPFSLSFLKGAVMFNLPYTLLSGLILGVVHALLHPLQRPLIPALNRIFLFLLSVAIDAILLETLVLLFKNSFSFQNFWWAAATAFFMNAARFIIDLFCGEFRK